MMTALMTNKERRVPRRRLAVGGLIVAINGGLRRVRAEL